MNTNPDATKILCYGDSNTWGQKPDKSGRYRPDVRWPGRLQQSLGDSHDIMLKFNLENCTGNAPTRMYKATVSRRWVNDGIEKNGFYVDKRVQI